MLIEATITLTLAMYSGSTVKCSAWEESGKTGYCTLINCSMVVGDSDPIAVTGLFFKNQKSSPLATLQTLAPRWQGTMSDLLKKVEEETGK